MAKKKPKSHASSEKRHGSVTVADLELCHADLDDLTAGIRVALDAAKTLNTKEILIDGATKWQRGFSLLNQYLNNVNKGIRDTRAAERGR